jgi:hypothetical protein
MFPGLWVLQIGQAFGLMPGGFSPGLPPHILDKGNPLDSGGLQSHGLPADSSAGGNRLPKG